MELPFFRNALLLTLLGLNLLVQSASAPIESDGTLDHAFDAGNFTNGRVGAAVLQPDAKLLIAGEFNKVHGVTRHSVARLNTDGTLDLSFDPGSSAESGVKGVIVQTDGKIIIVGFFSGIARLNNDGSLDNSFDLNRAISLDGFDDGSGGATNPGIVYSAVLQPDGKIVVVGQFFHIITGPGTSAPRSCVARFNSDGTFDPSYDPGAGAVNSGDSSSTVVTYAVRQSVGSNSGKIIIEGNFDIFDDHFGVPGLVRLNTDGSFDNTFTPGTGTDSSSVSGLFVQSDDQIVIFGRFTFFSGVACSGIVRLTPSGVVDGGFGTAAFENYDALGAVVAVAQQPNGKLIVAGPFHSLGGVVANNVVRLETSGARDIGFDATAAGPSASSISAAILVRPTDGKIFVGGYFSTYGGALRNNIAWANGDGSVDSTFTGLSGATDAFPQIYALATQNDGKILVGGFFSSFNGTSHYNLVRLNADSTLDPTFDVTLSGSVRALLIQPDGKIVIAGFFQAVNGVARGRVARLNADGALDTSFDPGAGADAIIYALARDSTGNVYVGGDFQFFDGTYRGRVAKLSPTGALDPTFQGNGANNIVYAIAPPDGAGGIVIGGAFSLYDGATARRIARLSATTSEIDFGFNSAGAGFNSSVRALLLASDGKYYAGGAFTTYNGLSRSRVARLNDDGSLDGTFVGPSIDGVVFALALQNGKIFVGGSFTSPPGQIVRLTGSGALDSIFVTDTGIATSPANAYVVGNPTVSALAIQPDGKLLIGGIFNQYNGTPRVCLARLTAVPLKITSITRPDSSHILLQGSGVPNAIYTVQASPDLNPTNFGFIGNATCDVNGSWQYTDTLPDGLTRRFYRLTSP